MALGDENFFLQQCRPRPTKARPRGYTRLVSLSVRISIGWGRGQSCGRPPGSASGRFTLLKHPFRAVLFVPALLVFLPDVGARLWAEDEALRADVARLDAAWSEALAHSGGPFLFGEFSAADAYFAPVAVRLSRFGLPVSEAAAAYRDALLAHPAVEDWVADAMREQDFVPEDEPYRQGR